MNPAESPFPIGSIPGDEVAETTSLDVLQPGIDWQRLLQKPVEELSTRERAEALSICDLLVKALGERAEAFKNLLRAEVLLQGTKTTASTTTATFGEVVLAVTQKEPSVSVNEVKLRLLLLEHRLDVETVFDRVPVLNEKRLEQLIASGVFSQEEVQSITTTGKTPTPSISVKKHVLGLTKSKLLERP